MNVAEYRGVEIHLGAIASYAEKNSNHIKLDIVQNGNKIKTKSSILIGADGPHSKIRKIFNFPEPAEFLKGIGAKAINTNLDPKYVEIFLGRNIAPGFFAWAIPTNDEGTEARIGLCIDRTSKNTLKKCFNNLLKHKRLKNIKTSKYIAGTIPLGPLKRTTISNVFLVGDAAAQVKPTSGGGIYPGLLCAKHCISVTLDALEHCNFNNKILRKYHKLWTSEIGKELIFGMMFRKIIKNFDDNMMDKYLNKINNEKSIDIINKNGDIDYPSKLALPLIKKNPSLIKLLPSAFKKLK
jgi:flavin-dependent dehydrogenase